MAWAFTINIKKHLSADESKEAMQAAYDAITKECQAIPIPLPAAWHRYCKLGIEQEDVKIWNMGLAALYDWADEYRIWCGM